MVKGENPAAKVDRLVAIGRGVKGVGDDPEGLWAASCVVDGLRMTAGQGGIGRIADQEHWEGAFRDGSNGRDLRGGETGEGLSAPEEQPGTGSEESFAEPGIFLQARVVVGSFAKAGEGGFGDDRLDAGVDSGGLQGDARAHGFAEGEDVGGMLGSDEGVEDGAGVLAFEPAVGGDGSIALAVGAGIHEDDGVACVQQDLGLIDHADAVIGDAVKRENPVAVGVSGANFPSAQSDAIASGDCEVFEVGAGRLETQIGLMDQVGSEQAALRMKKCGSEKPSTNCRKQHGEQDKKQGDAEGLAHIDIDGKAAQRVQAKCADTPARPSRAEEDVFALKHLDGEIEGDGGVDTSRAKDDGNVVPVISSGD